MRFEAEFRLALGGCEKLAHKSTQAALPRDCFSCRRVHDIDKLIVAHLPLVLSSWPHNGERKDILAGSEAVSVSPS